MDGLFKVSNFTTLTARVDEADTLLGFKLGTDNYATKPYIPLLLLARTKQLFDSRTFKKNYSIHILSSTCIHVHFLLPIATLERKDISLTHTELHT